MICVVFFLILYDGSTQRLTESGFMEKSGIEPATPGLQGIGRNQYWAGRVYDLCVYYMTGTPEGSTESGFLENHGGFS